MAPRPQTNRIPLMLAASRSAPAAMATLPIEVMDGCSGQPPRLCGNALAIPAGRDRSGPLDAGNSALRLDAEPFL